MAEKARRPLPFAVRGDTVRNTETGQLAEYLGDCDDGGILVRYWKRFRVAGGAKIDPAKWELAPDAPLECPRAALKASYPLEEIDWQDILAGYRGAATEELARLYFDALARDRAYLLIRLGDETKRREYWQNECATLADGQRVVLREQPQKGNDHAAN